MTVRIDWPPDVVDRLTDEARNKGLSLDAYLLQTILQQKGTNGAPSDDAQERRKRADGVFPGAPANYTNAVFQAVSSSAVDPVAPRLSGRRRSSGS